MPGAGDRSPFTFSFRDRTTPVRAEIPYGIVGAVDVEYRDFLKAVLNDERLIILELAGRCYGLELRQIPFLPSDSLLLQPSYCLFDYRGFLSQGRKDAISPWE